jgi:menaquinone-dependent protoporphyrinogen oxidase
MKKVLIAYTTNSGSTERIAQLIGEELDKSGHEVRILRLEEVTSLKAYDLVVVGAPMILGWHRRAVKFVKQHQAELSKLPVAYFFAAMSLTQTGEERVGDVPVYIDPGLAKPPAKAGRLSFRERYATPGNYLKSPLRAAPSVKPLEAAFFGGKLEMYRLKFLQMLFVMLVVRAQPGDLRDWDYIRGWAAGLGKRHLGAP